jgi:hybrid polyketide synthase/nonribosomal peptide synthetase FtdB
VREAAPGARRELVAGYLATRVAGVLGLAPRDVPADEPIGLLGLDSLMALELQARIVTDLGRRVPLAELLGTGTITSLAEGLASGDALPEPAAAADVVEGEL